MVEPVVLVGAGGALGAVLRHAVTEAVAAESFPVGTLAVNVLGSFALGAVTAAGAGSDLLLFVGTGVCGAFTTFSSFSVDAVRLVDEGRFAAAAAYALGTLACALGAVGLAFVAFG